MKKEKQVRSYKRRTKSGKTVTVKAHTAKYDASDRVKEISKKEGAGKELEERKKKPVQLEIPFDKEEEKKVLDEVKDTAEKESSKKPAEKKTTKKVRPVGSGTKEPTSKRKSEAKVTKSTASTSEPAFTTAEFKEWYRGTGSATDKKVAKELRAQLGRSGYRKLEDEAIDNYSPRGHLSMYKRVSGGNNTSTTTSKSSGTTKISSAKAPKNSTTEIKSSKKEDKNIDAELKKMGLRMHRTSNGSIEIYRAGDRKSLKNLVAGVHYNGDYISFGGKNEKGNKAKYSSALSELFTTKKFDADSFFETPQPTMQKLHPYSRKLTQVINPDVRAGSFKVGDASFRMERTKHKDGTYTIMVGQNDGTPGFTKHLASSGNLKSKEEASSYAKKVYAHLTGGKDPSGIRNFAAKSSTKKSSVGTGTNGQTSSGVSSAEFKAWYHDPKSKEGKAATKKLKEQIGAEKYKELNKKVNDSYSSRGHLSLFKRVSGGNNASTGTKSTTTKRVTTNKDLVEHYDQFNKKSIDKKVQKAADAAGYTIKPKGNGKYLIKMGTGKWRTTTAAKIISESAEDVASHPSWKKLSKANEKTSSQKKGS